jgi:hypothetical protein
MENREERAAGRREGGERVFMNDERLGRDKWQQEL